MHPRNSWDLKACKQKDGETLCEYIYHFSKQCNELPNIVDADVIGAFIFGTTNEALIHKHGRNKPQTMRELLNHATSHASGEEAIRANFCKYKGKAQSKPMDEGKDHAQWGRARRTVGDVMIMSSS